MAVVQLVFLANGESVWNAENRFTGWHDVDLSPAGKLEAVEAGKMLKKAGFKFDIVFTSVLRRAVKTAWAALTESENFSMPIINSWRLNERHYGGLQGLNKAETAEKYSEKKVKIWRRSYDVTPPAIDSSDPRHPRNDPLYKNVPPNSLPGAESLALTVDRVLPLWFDQILPCLMSRRRMLVVAHSNSLRALCKHIEGTSETEVIEFNIPTGVPLVYELDRNMKFIRKYYLMEAGEVAKKVAAIVDQGRPTVQQSANLSVETLKAAPYSQAHLFDGVSADVQASIAKQLSNLDKKLPGGGLKGYLTRARILMKEEQADKNSFEGLTPRVPSGERLSGDTGPGSTAYAGMETLGMTQLQKSAFCLVAGGLGERLGYPGIKIGITSELTTGKTFIETYIKYILAFQAHARMVTGSKDFEIPLAIMTSGDTHWPTLDLLEQNCNFGMSPSQITLMKQEKVPALLDVDARIACKNGKVETKPHGHGDVHALLHQQGLTKKWASEGREWLVLFQDTNPLPFRSMCAVLGVSAKNKFVMNSVTVPRVPGEAVGAICHLSGPNTDLTLNVEYHQLDPLLKDATGSGDQADSSGFSPYPGNINILVFKIPEFAKRLDVTGGIVPEFVNPKWADAQKTKFKSATRLECMMQDFPRLCGPSDKVGFTQLDRIMCFTCVKNNIADAAKKNPPDCALSCEADIYRSNAMLLRLAGADVTIEDPDDVSFLGISNKIGARIIMEPSFGVSLEAMKQKVKGKIKISKKSVLMLEGDVVVDGLDLDGTLKVTGTGVLKDKTVKNAGTPLVEIPAGDLPNQRPSLQIRGYTLAVGESENVTVVTATAETKIRGWTNGLPQDRDITNPDQPKQIEALADDIIASVEKGEVNIEDLKSLVFPKSKDYPVMFITAIMAAESALKLKKCPPHHHTIIHAMYNEHVRIKSKAENDEGQDFVRVKVGSMNWLYGKYAAPGSSWNYIAVDDGCPQDPPSGKLMEDVIKKEGYNNVEVVYIQSGIDKKIPPFNQLQTPKDSRKGGAILYGLHCAAQLKPGKKHVASYYDADLSADLTLIGLLVHPILCEGKKLGVGQRYGCPGSFLALPEGANGHPNSLYANTDCFRMMFRHFARGVLMPSLKPVYDTQCAFKSIEVDKLAEIVPKINEFGPGFDMELLIVAAKYYGGYPFKLVPFLFVEDKVGSTMSSTDDAATKSFHNMLKAMVQIHERCFSDVTMSDADKAWIQFFRDVPLEGYQRMIAGIKEKFGPTPPEALDTVYVLDECKKLAGM